MSIQLQQEDALREEEPKKSDSKLTPMMQQWQECKNQAKEALLFFRLGDFYEAFHDDAKVAAKELDLTLTQRQEIPMCGIPWHASESYIERLVAKGIRVAIAEQVEDPKKAKGLVSRKLVRIVSPATHVSSSQDKSHSFFATVVFADERYGLALIDLATATFTVFECLASRELAAELFRQQPKELLVSRRFQAKNKAFIDEISLGTKIVISCQEDWLFDPVATSERLCAHFNVTTLDGFGLKGMKPAIIGAGALLHHLKDWLLCPIDHLRSIRPYFSHRSLLLDRATLTNLEILEPIDKQDTHHSLLSLLDETKTPMGARLLRQWLKSPLVDLDPITARQNAIGELLSYERERPDVICCFDEKLEQIRDLERQMFRIKTATAGPREYVSLRASLEQLPFIKDTLKGFGSERLSFLYEKIDTHTPCALLIRNALVDSPPYKVADGSLFQEGFCKELDELKALRTNSQEWLVSYQSRLRSETGIKNLKVGFNRMFGYYIEVSRLHAEKLPSTLERRQTLVNGERYISQELKEYEEKVLSADGRITELELQLFNELRLEIAKYHDAILQTAQSVAELDSLRSLAIVAKKRNYYCPTIDTSRILWIKESRHPIIEALPQTGRFVTNDLYLDGENQALICLTGPNMAGKSTFIRQIALIVIMAQIGSFIPAREARIGIVDKVFSRIGASDDLARGQSTFMVEMAETASILNLATERSLVILDEIGRGTSTYDGISIAWAVAEYLVKRARGKPKTLFATHYYELTALEKCLPGVVNHTVAISETKDEIVFLRKIVPGKTDRSYGIHVARLAGMPDEVIKRAEERLLELEKNPMAPKQKAEQKDLFAEISEPRLHVGERAVLKELGQIDLSAITGLDALIRVAEWQKVIKKCIQ